MIGAILGDIIGSFYEFRNRIKTEDFELFPKEAKFTDDTVLTIATADALLHNKSGDKAYYEWVINILMLVMVVCLVPG